MPASEDTIGAALRDFALDQVAQVDMQLARAGAWQHDGVHNARKAIARLRACLVLLRESALAARALETHLRALAHGLSELRDSQAAFATAKRLRGESRDARERTVWRELAQELKAQRERSLGAALVIDPGYAAHRRDIAETRSAITAIAWTRLSTGDVERALALCAKRARKARDGAREATAEAPRHKLRRRSRRLLLQIELLRTISRDATRPRAAAAAHAALDGVFHDSKQRKSRKDVVEALGWEQDLRVLRRALQGRAPSPAQRRVLTLLRAELQRAQAATNKKLD
jgi:hypothetical protein